MTCDNLRAGLTVCAQRDLQVKRARGAGGNISARLRNQVLVSSLGELTIQ
jgi:hypothetical protein